MNKNKHKTINESPDSVESTGQYYTHNGSYPFVVFKGFPHEILIGNDGERHDSFEERIRLGDLDISPELYHSISTKKIKLGYNTSYEVCGRCWVNGQGNTISIWSYDINNYKRVGEKILPIVKALQNNGVNIDIETLDFDDWEGNLDSIFPFTWLLNGIADIYKKEALQIKEKNGKYIIFCKNGKTLICDRGGHIFEQNNKQKNINKKMSKKNIVRLTESQLKRVISESVRNVLNEEKPRLTYDGKKADPSRPNSYAWRQNDKEWGKEQARNLSKAIELIWEATRFMPESHAEKDQPLYNTLKGKGYHKSNQRINESWTLLRKVIKLLETARQDLWGGYDEMKKNGYWDEVDYRQTEREYDDGTFQDDIWSREEM